MKYDRLLELTSQSDMIRLDQGGLGLLQLFSRRENVGTGSRKEMKVTQNQERKVRRLSSRMVRLCNTVRLLFLKAYIPNSEVWHHGVCANSRGNLGARQGDKGRAL